MASNKNNQKTTVAPISPLSPAVSDDVSETKEDTKEMLHLSKTERVETLKDACCSKKDEDHVIQIFVNKCGMAPICLRQHPWTTIFTLKGTLQDILGIQAEKQHLSTMKGILLCDELSLEEQQIEQDTNLELSIGPGLLGGARKRKINGGKQKRGYPKPPSKENTRQQDQSDKRQSYTGFKAILYSMWISIWTFFGTLFGTQQSKPQQSEPTVRSIRAVKSPMFNGPAFGNTIIYNNSPGPSGGNDDIDGTTDPQRRRARQSHAADLCEEELRARYIDKDSLVQMNPLLEKLHIQHIFTDLVLESHDEGGGPQERRRNLESYAEVFTIETREGKLVNLTIFEGKAGLGKSTLISKIKYDWAYKPTEVLKKYKLVFALKMHALEETSDFIKAVFNQLLAKDTKVVETDLLSYIEAHPENVLILLDGFDEFMTTNLDQAKFGSLLEIVSRKRLCKCYIVVTTRPSQYHTLRTELIPDTMNRVKVLGFRKEDIEKYVKRVYSNKTEKAKKLLQEIGSSDVLSELVKSPMLLLMVCALWQESSLLPVTLFLLYKDALEYLFQRKEKRALKEKARLPACLYRFMDALNWLFGRKGKKEEGKLRVVNTIGKVALNGLLSAVQTLSFPETLFEKRALDAALEAGILTKQMVSNGLDVHNSIQFLHKTLQEFCAGLYLQYLQKNNLQEFQTILGRMSNLSNLDYVLRFCCGGNDECTNAVLAVLKEKCPEDHSSALNCYFENQSKEPPTDDFVELVVTDKLSIKGYDGDSLCSFVYFLNRVTSTKKNKGAAFLRKVKKIVVQSSNLEKFINKLLPLMGKMCSLKVLKLKYCQGLGGSESWGSHLHAVQKLCLLGCCLAPKDLKLIALRSVESLNLSNNKALGGSSSLWVPYLRKMHCFRKLTLEYCELKHVDVQHIATIATLVSLNLSHNDKLGRVAEMWVPHLEKMENLTELKLGDCSLVCGDVKVLAGMVKLINLKLSGNVELRHSASDWSKSLCSLEHLEILHLNDCNIATEDLRFIAKSCSDMPSLVSWSVDNNVHPKMNYQLKISDGTTVHLRGCSISNENLVDILKMISKRSCLKELKLSEFEILDPKDTAWCAQLQQFKHLERLVFNSCGLRDTTIQRILEQLMNMHDLTELYLNGNTNLKGTAHIWFPFLQSLAPLKMLVLDDCNLTREDWEHIKTDNDCTVKDSTVHFK